MLKTVYFCVFFFLTSIACANQTQTPESVVAEYFKTLKTEGYGAIAKYIHPDEQKKFKDMTHAKLEEMLLSISIDDPNAASLLSDPKDGSKIRKFSDAEYLNAVMKWQELLDPGLLDYIRKANIKIIGSVKENKITHVIVRFTVNHNDLMTVISLKDFKGTPKLLLTSEMQGIIKAL